MGVTPPYREEYCHHAWKFIYDNSITIKNDCFEFLNDWLKVIYIRYNCRQFCVLYYYNKTRKECTITAPPGVWCAPNFYRHTFMLHQYLMWRLVKFYEVEPEARRILKFCEHAALQRHLEDDLRLNIINIFFYNKDLAYQVWFNFMQ